eukprot:scaffold482_cov266-Amphora_coffeaeformis.AAC.66
MSKKSRAFSQITNADEGGGESDSTFDLDIELYSNSDDVYTTSSEEGGDDLERGKTLDCSDHSSHSVTYISQDLLMLPRVNQAPVAVRQQQQQQQQQQQRAKLHPEEQDELDMEQPSGEPTSKKTYKYRLLPWLDCCVFPRFIRAAPTWLKMIMMLSMSIIFFGLCLYAAAALLQAEFDDDGGSTTGTDETDVPASQVILEQGVEMFGWEDSLTLSPTAQVVVASLKKRTRSPP